MIISLIFTFAYLFTWVKYQQYHFLERDYTVVANHKEFSKLWHLWKGANQAVFFTLIMALFGWKLMVVNMAFFWFMFDGLLNSLVLKREFFYAGYTSWMDRALRSTTGLLNKLLSPVKTTIDASTVSFICKIALLTISLYFYL